jgi:ssDNA-binding Zn-finger/Zn-ribbon topoisomerase 1
MGQGSREGWFRQASWCKIRGMKKGDVICPNCRAGFRRLELSSQRGPVGDYRCPVCNEVLEIFDGSKQVAYRLTVAPVRLPLREY